MTSSRNSALAGLGLQRNRQQKRADARAARRRAEHDTARANGSAWNEYVDGHIASALAAHRHEVEELARASIAFADAVSARLRELERLTRAR
jgi:hypothetical protein